MGGPEFLMCWLRSLIPFMCTQRSGLNAPSQEVFPILQLSHSPPPPPLDYCPRGDFTDKLASFLQSYASVISTKAPIAFELLQ